MPTLESCPAYQIIKAEKADKKDIKRFYRQQNYSAGFLGLDHCYLVRFQQKIIAAVIVSQIKPENDQHFLHALMVDGQHRQKHLASALLHHTIKHHQPLVCFSGSSLATLYTQMGFKLAKPCDLTQTLNLRFQAYCKKINDLLIFIHQANDDKN